MYSNNPSGSVNLKRGFGTLHDQSNKYVDTAALLQNLMFEGRGRLALDDDGQFHRIYDVHIQWQGLVRSRA